MFSQTTEYALRGVAHLASQSNHESTIPIMAEAIQVNAPYLRKVVAKLRNAEIVGAHRGRGGGVVLKIDPGNLTILDVINATDPIQLIERCPLGLSSHLKLCALHTELNEAIKKVVEVLGSKTIGELLSATRSTAHCSFPLSEELLNL